MASTELGARWGKPETALTFLRSSPVSKSALACEWCYKTREWVHKNAELKLARAHVPLNDSYPPSRALELERGICDADWRFD